MIIFKKERWNPTQEQPQRPPVTEVDDGDRQNPPRQPQPRHRPPRPDRRRQRRQVSSSNRAMFPRIVTKIPGPHHQPQKAGDSQHHKRSPPGNHHQQRRNQRRRHRIPHPRKRMRDPLREAPLRNRRPASHRPCSRGQRRPFAEPQRQPHRKQRSKPAHRAREYGGHPHNRAPHRQRQPRPELIPNPPTDQLEQRIRNRKRRKRQTQLRVAQMQIGLDQRSRRRHVHPIHKQDQVHPAQQPQHDFRSGEFRGWRSSHAAGRVSPLICVRCRTRRDSGSNGSRRCIVQRLSHNTTSPVRHWFPQLTSSRVV